MAVIECSPTERPEKVKAAKPEAKVAVPRLVTGLVLVSWRRTVPVGVPVAFVFASVTVAVKVTGSPKSELEGEDIRLVSVQWRPQFSMTVSLLSMPDVPITRSGNPSPFRSALII